MRSVVRAPRSADVASANDEYQDARLRAEQDDRIEMEVIHYPLAMAGEAVVANPDWRKTTKKMAPYLKSTATSSWDGNMRKGLHADLREQGVDPDSAENRTLAEVTALDESFEVRGRLHVFCRRLITREIRRTEATEAIGSRL
ncbi:MAG: hypothetical protein ACI841_003294 [Planctomycetota bacterium]